jgi:tripartite-type tricarboxylate transporter receptor subunit TctC
MARKIVFVFALFLVIALLLPGCSKAGDSSGAKWTPTNPITIVVHMGTGSSYDNYSRGIAPYLKKYLGVDVMVKNTAGAGGLTGLLEVWRAKPDGYTLGIVDVEKFVAYQMVAKMDYDIRQFMWLNSPAGGHYVMATSAKFPYNTMKEIVAASKTKPMRYITTEVGTTEVITNAVTGMNATYITGSAGGAEMYMEMIKGNADLKPNTDSMTAPFLKSGDLKAIMYYGDKNSAILDSIGVKCQTASEAGYPELAALFGPRGFTAPPGTPANIMAALDEAFTKSYADPDLLAWGTKSNAPIVPLNKAELAKAVDDLANLYNKYSTQLKEYIKL